MESDRASAAKSSAVALLLIASFIVTLNTETPRSHAQALVDPDEEMVSNDGVIPLPPSIPRLSWRQMAHSRFQARVR